MANLYERLDALIDKRGPDECWPWLGTIARKGYGQISDQRRSLRVARLVLARKLGRALTSEEQACHTCDNPPCCNEAHLFAGSSADNQRDKKRKGRAAKGEANRGGGKLTEADVRAIRARIATGESKDTIGADYGVSRTMIYYIANGRQWSHVT